MVGWRNSYNIFIKLEITVKAEPNIRIRIRGAIIRIQIAEPSIRTIIRIRTEQSTPGDRHRVYFYFIFSILIFLKCFESSVYFAARSKPCRTAHRTFRTLFFNFGTSGTQYSHSNTRSEKTHSDSRTQHPHLHSHSHRAEHPTSLLWHFSRNNQYYL